MTMRPRGWFSLALVALALVLIMWAIRLALPSGPAAGHARAHAAASADAETGFRSHARLVEHFEKHGAEFHAASAQEYLRLALALRDRPAGGDVLERVRDDGAITRFDRASGAFIAFDRDGTIRTFFKPNDGERYFDRQARRTR